MVIASSPELRERESEHTDFAARVHEVAIGLAASPAPAAGLPTMSKNH